MSHMSQESGGDVYRSQAESEELAAFCASLESLRSKGVDAYEDAHNECLAGLLQTNRQLRSIFDQFLSAQPNLDPYNFAIRTVKSAQALEMSEDDAFPHGRNEPSGWLATYDRVLADKEFQEKYFMNLLLPIATNVSERGKLLKVVLLLHDKADEPRLLDIGCSLNHTLKRFALPAEDELMYDPVLVRDALPDQQNGGLNPEISDRLNQLINSGDFVLGESLGTDLWDAERDKMFRYWAQSNSFYMTELLDDKKVRRFNKLDQATPGQVHFMRVDATTHNPDLDGDYDVTYLSTMLYQLSESERKAVLENAFKSTNDTGLVVVQDYVKFNPDGSQVYAGKWDWHWSYNLWVFDKSNPNAGFQHYFTANNGRVQEVVVHSALGQLAARQGVYLTTTS